MTVLRSATAVLGGVVIAGGLAVGLASGASAENCTGLDLDGPGTDFCVANIDEGSVTSEPTPVDPASVTPGKGKQWSGETTTTTQTGTGTQGNDGPKKTPTSVTITTTDTTVKNPAGKLPTDKQPAPTVDTTKTP